MSDLKGAEIKNIHTIKPLDVKAVIESISKTKCAVTAEEHQLFGGLGDCISHALTDHMPVPLERIGVNDQFGESGTPEQLMKKYDLDAEHIVEAALKVVARKS